MSSSRTSSSSTWSEMVDADLQPHRRAEAAPGQLALQRLQQVLVAVVVHLELGVAGDPEQVVLDDLHAGEELAQVGGDQLLDRQEPRPRAVDAHPPAGPARRPTTNRGTLLGTLMRANSSGPPSGSRTMTARLSDRPEMYGNGCAGGHTTAEIAGVLGVAPKTVRNRSSLLYRRLGVRSRSQAVRVAEVRGLLDRAPHLG